MTEKKDSENTDELFQKVREQYEDIKIKVAEAYRQAGIAPEQLSELLRSPNRFTPEAWQVLEATRYEEEKALAAKVGIAAQKAVEQKKRTAQAKKGRRKFLGARKKWMKMD